MTPENAKLIVTLMCHLYSVAFTCSVPIKCTFPNVHPYKESEVTGEFVSVIQILILLAMQKANSSLVNQTLGTTCHVEVKCVTGGFWRHKWT
jgi:hypothetical protein